MNLQAGRPGQIRRLGVPALAAGVLLAGCGSSSSSTTAATATTSPPSASTPAHRVSLAANPAGQLAYEQTSLSTTGGRVTIDFANASSLGHNVTVESSSGQLLGATPTFSGGTRELSLTLAPGTYTFYCSVPGHRMAGMEGTLTVRS